MFTYSNCCRLCLVNNGNMKDYNIPRGNSLSYFHKINKIMPTLLRDTSNILPTLICKRCEETIDITYNFIENCTKINKILKEYVVQCQTVINDDREPDSGKISRVKIKQEYLNGIESVDIPSAHSVFAMSINDSNRNSQYEFERVYVKTENNEINNIFSNSESLYENQFDSPEWFERTRDNLSIKNVTKLPEQNVIILKNNINRSEQKYISIHPSTMTATTSDGTNMINAIVTKSTKISHSGKEKLKGFSCDVCGKTFRISSILKRHERTHTGERPYSCKICFKAFKDSSHVRIHERFHSVDKPFQCKVCEKGFRLSSDLKKHERVHTGERPYICHICGKAFTDSSNLRVHERIH